MIAPGVVDQVRRLLAEGELSQRKIAATAGISRGTVGAIAAGRRPDHDASAACRRGQLLPRSGPPRRCPGCGGMVYMPCRLCRLRAELAAGSKPPGQWPARPDEPLELELTAEHRDRYQQVRAQRTANEMNDE